MGHFFLEFTNNVFGNIFQELNLDLVQFPRAVLVSEVRVVPLGTRVQVDVPGGVRLGYVTVTTRLHF